MMRKLLAVAGVLALCASFAPAQITEEAQIRLLRAENRLLKAQVKALQKKLGMGPAVKATTQPADTPKTGPTKTFAIHEDSPTWWQDPAALTFEVHLREILAPTMPLEAPATWMMRNNFMAGRELNWTLQLVSVSTVTETAAGQQFWSGRASRDSQRKQIASLKDQARTTTDAARKAGLVEALVTVEQKLAQAEAQSRLWKKLLEFKGGTVLHAMYRQSRRGTYHNALDVKMALPPEDAEKLTAYQNDKRTKHPTSRQQYWPVRISGKVDSVLYDGTTIHTTVEGKWHSVVGDGLARKVPPRTKRVRLVPAQSGDPSYLNLRY